MLIELHYYAIFAVWHWRERTWLIWRNFLGVCHGPWVCCKFENLKEKNITKSHWIRSVDEAAANAPTSEQGITRPATIPPPLPPTSPPQSDRQKTKIYPDLTNFEENSHVDEVGSCGELWAQKIFSWPRQTDRQCQLLSCPGQLKSIKKIFKNY